MTAVSHKLPLLGAPVHAACERAGIDDATGIAYQRVLAIHAEGSVEAEKMMVYRSYDPATARPPARELAGLG